MENFLGYIPIGQQKITVPTAEVPWWQKVGSFIDKATEVYNTAKPVVTQAQAAINNFKNNNNNDTAFNYEVYTTPQGNQLSMGVKIAIGVVLFGAVVGGVYLATKSNKKKA